MKTKFKSRSFASLMGLLLLFSSCVTAGKDFKRAQEIDSIQAYNEFLANHPQGQYSQQARTRIEELKWERAKRLDSLSSYKEYLAAYPNGKFKTEAKKLIEQKWEAIRKNIKSIKIRIDKVSLATVSSKDETMWRLAYLQGLVETPRVKTSGRNDKQISHRLKKLIQEILEEKEYTVAESDEDVKLVAVYEETKISKPFYRETSERVVEVAPDIPAVERSLITFDFQMPVSSLKLTLIHREGDELSGTFVKEMPVITSNDIPAKIQQWIRNNLPL